MKCPKCKAEIKAGDAFCSHCGAQLSDGKKPNHTLKFLIGGAAVLLALGVGYAGYSMMEDESVATSQNQRKKTIRKIVQTKHFVNDKQVYTDVTLNLEWPESLGTTTCEVLQKAMMNKLFGFNKPTIDEAITVYYASLGKEIPEVPEWDMNTERHDIVLSIEEESFIPATYTSYSVSYRDMDVRGSIHAADHFEHFVNYDIQHQMLLSASDIINQRTSASDLLSMLKDYGDGDWENVEDPTVLPNEVLLTEQGLIFGFKGWNPKIQRITLESFSRFVTDRVLSLLAPKNEVTFLSNDQSKMDFLKEFYTNYIFGSNDFSTIARLVTTPRMLNELADAYEYECPTGDCYAVWSFRTGNQDGPSDVSEVTKIIPQGDGWYKVDYLDMGTPGSTSVRLVEHEGRIKIDALTTNK